jgi:hypothetical protein
MAAPVELFGNTTDIKLDDPSVSVEDYLKSVCEAHVAQLIEHSEQTISSFRERAQHVRVELANSNAINEAAGV